MFDVPPIVYSFMKTDVTTFFTQFMQNDLRKPFKFFFHAYQVASCFSIRSPKTQLLVPIFLD